jgi:hypothetical protein
MEGSSPASGAGVFVRFGLDQLQSGNLQPAKTMPKELGQPQATVTDEGGSDERFQRKPPELLLRSPNRHVVEDRLGKGAVEIACSIEIGMTVPAAVVKG